MSSTCHLKFFTPFKSSVLEPGLRKHDQELIKKNEVKGMVNSRTWWKLTTESNPKRNQY